MQDEKKVAQAFDAVARAIRSLASLPDVRVHPLTTYAMAEADGLFIAQEISGDAIDLLTPFETHAHSQDAIAR